MTIALRKAGIPHLVAVEKGQEVTKGCCKRGCPPPRIVLAGDWAGGALALSLAQALKRQVRPPPAAMLLSSPVVDATLQRPPRRVLQE
jgi:acetyl esterase/lipase